MIAWLAENRDITPYIYGSWLAKIRDRTDFYCIRTELFKLYCVKLVIYLSHLLRQRQKT